MSSIIEDPLYNVIENGIKQDIDVVLQHGRFRAAVILIYSGMDMMAYLDMPSSQITVTREDFIRWADRYIRFPCKEQISGIDFYGARCGMLHEYSTESNMSRLGRCRQIGYADDCIPEVRFAPHISQDLVIVSVKAMKKAFFDGINAFLISAYTDSAKKTIVDNRLNKRICDFEIDSIVNP